MTKADLIQKVAKNTGLTKKDTERVIANVLSEITDALVKGERVQLVGFGAFIVRNRSARNGKNPSNGKPMYIPATKIPAFKAGKALRDAVTK